MKKKRRVRVRVIRSMFPTDESITQENIEHKLDEKLMKYDTIKKANTKIEKSLDTLGLLKSKKESNGKGKI